MVIVPTVIERNLDSERIYDLYSCLLKERIIILTGEINDQMASSICTQLLYLSSLNHGGSVSAGLAIYDIMKHIPCDVSTICMGMCASMAAVLLAAGTKGKRSALKNSEIMIHQPLGGMQGQATDMEIAAQHIKKMKHKLINLLSENSNQPYEQIQQDCERDYYMSPEDAISYGLIDTIIS